MKKLKKFLFCIILFFYFISVSYALDKFMPFGHVPEGLVYIDMTNIFFNGTKYQCCMKMPNSREVLQSLGDYFFDHVVAKVEIDIVKKLYRIVEALTYDSSGRLLNRFDFYSSSFWTSIETGTPIEGLYVTLAMIERDMPEYIKAVQSPSPDRYLYIAASDSNNEFYLDRNSVSFNPQTQIIKFEIKTVFDKVELKKILNTRRFRSIKRKVSSASHVITSYYINLSTNNYASIHSSWYSDSVFLFDVEDDCKYKPISSSPLLTKVREMLLNLIRSELR